jgi:hypothetical protein
MSSKFFNKDREYKYFWGIFRLSVVLIISFVFSFSEAESQENGFWKYCCSYRWISHVYVGVMGAVVNVKCLRTGPNLVIMSIAGLAIINDILRFDISLCIYLLKTFCGDYLAGKLDTVEWKIGKLLLLICI